MAKMNEQEIKRTFEAMGAFEPDHEVMVRDLEAIRGQIAGPTDSVRPGPVNPWRTLMTSKWTRIASVAAALLVSMTLLVTFFPGSQLNAAELLTRVAKNLDTLTWVKHTSQRALPDQNEPVSITVAWFDMSRKRVYQVTNNTHMGLADYKRWEKSSYKPETNQLVISELKGTWISPSTDIQKHLDRIQNEGLEVRQTKDRIQGEPVIIVEYAETFNDLGQDKTTKQTIGDQYVKTVQHKLVIRQSDFLPETISVVYRNHDGNILMTILSQLEYVQAGPADIYELGVPRDVQIINKVPSRAVRDLRSKITEHRDQFLNEYMATIIESGIVDGQVDPMEALVSFLHGKEIPIDQYLRYSRSTMAFTQKHEKDLAASLACLEKYWTEKETQCIRSVRLYDGLWLYSVKTRKQEFIALEKQRHAGGDPFRDVDITDMGWPQLYWLEQPQEMIEDSYAKDHGLVGMGVACQWQGGFRLPKRLRLYVDPNRDYLTHRYISEEVFDAPWQVDKDWLNSAEYKEHLRAEVRDHQVTEYGRTSQGQWYPKEITIQGYDQRYDSTRESYSRIVRIHLIEENPEFPQALFDPNALPKPSVENEGALQP